MRGSVTMKNVTYEDTCGSLLLLFLIIIYILPSGCVMKNRSAARV